ncbi:MAG: endolytic transglycosylase MltG [Ottowia sp.]|nr:endolytic transglycosylase MltG [Ottowia sp.]
MRTLLKLVALLLAVALAAAGGAWWWTQQPLPMASDALEVSVPAGASLRTAAQRLHEVGVQVPPRALEAYFRYAARGRSIQAGDYAIKRGMKPQDVLERLVRGERITRSVTLVEGWTFRQALQALARAPDLRHDASTLTPEAVMAALGRPGVAAEGRFFPDTFHYTKGDSELDILRQSMQLMERRLEAAWDARAPDVPLQNAEEVLILASIIEKETGRAADRAEIAGVFANRLRLGMKLQTDPTVIYGLGDAFDGKLRRSQLDADTPYNTYTRAGLPPTPIALPGKAALLAAVRPADTRALYFVARGDGSSHFSQTLDEHNRAVQRYQRGGAKP